MAPPPPPPPICIPGFGKKKKERRLSFSEKSMNSSQMHHLDQLGRASSFSPTTTMVSRAAPLTFISDSERYTDAPGELISRDKSGKARLFRGNTMTGTKRGGLPTKWGYGWGIGKNKKLQQMAEEDDEESILPPPLPENDTPLPTPPRTQIASPRHMHDPLSRSNTQNSKGTIMTGSSQRTKTSKESYDTNRTKTSKTGTYKSQKSYDSRDTARSGSVRRPALAAHDSTSTLVGSKLSELTHDSVRSRLDRSDSGPKLEQLRASMKKDNLDY
jgi:Xaa-Pro aminopeptidase